MGMTSRMSWMHNIGTSVGLLVVCRSVRSIFEYIEKERMVCTPVLVASKFTQLCMYSCTECVHTRHTQTRRSYNCVCMYTHECRVNSILCVRTHTQL
jgi:hypothetical protein